MRADDESRARSPQYQAGPFDRTEAGLLPARAPRESGTAHGALPGTGDSRLSRMLRAQAQHHQGRR